MRVSTTSHFDGKVRTNTVLVDGKPESWWKISPGLAIAPPVTSNFAAVAMLPFAMRNGSDLHVAGQLDSVLWDNLEDLVEAWSMWRPDLYRRIRISADDVSSHEADPDLGAALMFSGGVDATFALAAHQTGLLGHRSSKIRYGLLVHGFDIPLERRDWFHNAYRHAEQVLTSFDAESLTVATNWRKQGLNWEMAFGFGVAAVLHQMDGSCSKGFWAADEPFDHEIIPWGSNSISNPLMGGKNFQVRAVGMGQSRNDKVAQVAPFKSVREHLRVCWRQPENGQNCGFCEKCVRTRLNFLCAGYDDLPAFGGKLMPEHIEQLKIQNTPQADMLRQLMNSGGDRLPVDIQGALAQRLSEGLTPAPSEGRRVRSILGRLMGR